MEGPFFSCEALIDDFGAAQNGDGSDEDTTGPLVFHLVHPFIRMNG
jgi:hypothetical protein